MQVGSTKEELDYLLDTTAINKRIADQKDNPFRWRVGSFQVPKGVSGETLKKHCRKACDKFVSAYERQGWQLASKVQVYEGEPYAYDIRDGIPLLDMQEMRVRAIFKLTKEPQKIRIELPPTSVRHDPEETTTLRKVMKGEGIETVKKKDRLKAVGKGGK